MTRARVIGINGRLPWHYREDLKRFKRRTMNCAIIMGRITWDSLDHKPLPGRRNIVISRSAVAGVECYDGIEPALAACGDDDLWVIGGGQIYAAAMAHLNLLDVTFVPDVVVGEDAVKFPAIDLGLWQAGEESEVDEEAGLVNVVYRRI